LLLIGESRYPYKGRQTSLHESPQLNEHESPSCGICFVAACLVCVSPKRVDDCED
jgi:hypothetical protein